MTEELDDFDVEVQEDDVNGDSIPLIGSPEWSDYVLSLLQKDEKFEDAPTTDGLRRIAISLFGPFSYKLQVHAVNEQYAAVTAVLHWKDTEFEVIGSAECSAKNTDGVWGDYPLATAETRAEGRALKRALCLKKVLTAEETSKKAKMSMVVDDDIINTNMTDTQITFMDRRCKKYDISVKSLVEYVVGKFTDITKLTYSEGQEVNKILDDWCKNRPENIDNYDANWRNKE